MRIFTNKNLRKGREAAAGILCFFSIFASIDAKANPQICYMYAASKDAEGNEVPNIGVQGQGAYDYFREAFVNEGKGEFKPSYEMTEIDPAVTKCIWIHVDRMEIDEGWRHLPDEFSTPSFIDALHTYMLEGGNIYLSGQAVSLVSPIWRVAPTQKTNSWEHEPEGVWENKTWGICTLYKDQNQLHPIFDGLTKLDGNGDKYGILNGDFWYENHNTIWELDRIEHLYGSEGEEGEGENLTDRERFEIDNQASVLASFDWDNADNTYKYGGIVEFHPVYSWDYEEQSYSKQSGAIICNGIAAMQWRYFADKERSFEKDKTANTCRENLEKLTGNILDYLSSGNHIVKEGHPYNRPASNVVEEVLESTGLIAMYIGYENEDDPDFRANAQEYAAYMFFRDNYVNSPNFGGNIQYQNKYFGRGPQILWKGDKDKIKFCGQESKNPEDEGFECVWINIAGERANIIFSDKDGNPRPDNYTYTSEDVLQVFGSKEEYEKLISRLKQFRADGGNIYTTKFANLILEDLDDKIMTPTQVTKVEKTEKDKWGINVNFGGYDQSGHPIFSTLELVTRQHGQGVTLFTGEGKRLDTNCVWWLDNEHTGQDFWDVMGDTDRLHHFNSLCNATVLGVWGHADPYAFYTAGLVEFHPKRGGYNSQERVTPRPNVEARRGTIMSNGVGAYEWDTDENDIDDDKAVRQLTGNILSYLTPVMTEPTYTGIDNNSLSSDAPEEDRRYFNLQGIPVRNPGPGIYIEVNGYQRKKVILK